MKKKKHHKNTTVQSNKTVLKNLDQRKPSSPAAKAYTKFSKIDGTHPWQTQVKDGYILYSVRELENGKVVYFNYNLAKEMGLIDSDHPHKMNRNLEKEILKTFAIRILNEYDIENKIKFNPNTIKKTPYMATRYLQLQHSNKQGKTSGDGRSIWNGFIRHNGKTWDISSRGTGVTRLSPGSVNAGVHVQTGDESHGYSCGLIELDELYGTLITSEIFHQHGIPTERMLAIIDIGKGLGIGVRAGQNLLRPAHLFSFLKQSDYEGLKAATNYFIDRQSQNKVWSISQNSKTKYSLMLDNICRDFAKLTARFDVDYIFTWMDWDGDNILANAGIIDYGSIRQFGLRHDSYRYDDVDRFSTTLSEQKQKARLIVQIFSQLVDFLETREKKSLENFKDHKILKEFDKAFEHYRLKYRLHNVGLSKNDQEYLLKNHKDKIENFEKLFQYFEKTKTQTKEKKVADGINKPAIFSMRDLLRVLPSLYTSLDYNSLVDPSFLFDVMIASTASRKDSKMTDKQAQKIIELQKAYIELIECSRRYRSFSRMIQDVFERSKVINRADRITGNAVIRIVDQVKSELKRDCSAEQIQNAIDSFVKSQDLKPKTGSPNPEFVLKRKGGKSKKLLKSFLTLAEECKDEI